MSTRESALGAKFAPQRGRGVRGRPRYPAGELGR
jgi:hypothetical protein